MSDPRNFRIANSDITPNGGPASALSISGTGYPSTATWTANDKQYTVTLKDTIFEPVTPGGSLTFTIAKGLTSPEYKVKLNAPLGDQEYCSSITPPSIALVTPPKVLIQA